MSDRDDEIEDFIRRGMAAAHAVHAAERAVKLTTHKRTDSFDKIRLK